MEVEDDRDREGEEGGEGTPREKYRLSLTLSSHRCPTSCVDPSMPASRPAHSCRLPHAIFSWSPAALITSLARARQSVSPMLMGRTPGRLSSATRRHAYMVKLFNRPTTPTLSSYASSASSVSSSSHRLPLTLSSRRCPTACVAPSMPASRPVHSCRLTHAVFS